jgi:hypothetical protein
VPPEEEPVPSGTSGLDVRRAATFERPFHDGGHV